jgi:nucleoside-diphosphate-sugar epimerase
VVHLSSVSVYEEPPAGDWEIREEAVTLAPNHSQGDDYATSKRLAEILLDELATERGNLEVVHLRPSSIYGIGMAPSTLLPTIVGRAKQRQPIVLRGPRAYRQNFVHVLDVAEMALFLALSSSDVLPHAVNAFSDDTLSLFELVDLVGVHLGHPIQVIDKTEAKEIAERKFVNTRAKHMHPHFRSLSQHVLEAA